jgi:hypothetical protein
MARPRSTLNTFRAHIQMSARVLSIGMDVMLNNPKSKPHCNPMSMQLKATASTPGR